MAWLVAAGAIVAGRGDVWAQAEASFEREGQRRERRLAAEAGFDVPPERPNEIRSRNVTYLGQTVSLAKHGPAAVTPFAPNAAGSGELNTSYGDPDDPDRPTSWVFFGVRF